MVGWVEEPLQQFHLHEQFSSHLISDQIRSDQIKVDIKLR